MTSGEKTFLIQANSLNIWFMKWVMHRMNKIACKK